MRYTPRRARQWGAGPVPTRSQNGTGCGLRNQWGWSTMNSGVTGAEKSSGKSANADERRTWESYPVIQDWWPKFLKTTPTGQVQQPHSFQDAAKNAERIQRRGLLEDDLNRVCSKLIQFLLAKNDGYGDSALNPIHAFSTAPVMDRMDMRMDDKISRLVRGDNKSFEDKEEAAWDFLGYLLMREVAKMRVPK